MRIPHTIYVVRHGETDWNRERRYQGQTDKPMNARGREQAHRNGAALRSALNNPLEFDFAASPLMRARETMDIIREELGLAKDGYRTDPRLMELSYGSWEGKLQSDLPTLDPEGWAARARAPFTWRPEGGESYADLLVRCRSWLGSIERPTVVAAHGGISRCLRTLVLDLDPASIPDLESPQDKVLKLQNGTMTWI